ncbi:hypothetical protein ABID96_002272 [Bacillus sp. OAE603]
MRRMFDEIIKGDRKCSIICKSSSFTYSYFTCLLYDSKLGELPLKATYNWHGYSVENMTFIIFLSRNPYEISPFRMI